MPLVEIITTTLPPLSNSFKRFHYFDFQWRVQGEVNEPKAKQNLHQIQKISCDNKRDDDNDGIPDSYEEDTDGDGEVDAIDDDDGLYSDEEDDEDQDNDGIEDEEDPDDDNDGILDEEDDDDDNDGVTDDLGMQSKTFYSYSLKYLHLKSNKIQSNFTSWYFVAHLFKRYLRLAAKLLNNAQNERLFLTNPRRQ